MLTLEIKLMQRLDDAVPDVFEENPMVRLILYPIGAVT